MFKLFEKANKNVIIYVVKKQGIKIEVFNCIWEGMKQRRNTCKWKKVVLLIQMGHMQWQKKKDAKPSKDSVVARV